MSWYVRAVERALGLPGAVVDKAYLDGYLKHLADLVKGQIRYHHDTACRCHNMEKRLHYSGITLLGLTVLACITHLGLSIWHNPLWPEWPPRVLIFLWFLSSPGRGAGGDHQSRRVSQLDQSIRGHA